MDLDRAAGLREGIERALRDGMRDGRLPVGSALPSSRSLARDLGVARGTVSAAYRQLAAEGYLELRQGAPVRVRWTPRRRPPSSPPPARRAAARWDFRPGQPDCASFPRQAWARACRQVLAGAPDEVFGYGDPRGTPQLRRALSEYLGRARGDRGTSVLDQLTLADLIASGAFDRHVRRMRGIYRRRRDDLAQALARNQAGLHLVGISAGLHALARLPPHGPTEQQIRSRAARRSIALHTLGRYWYNPPQPAPQAVIIGYATPAGHAYRPALSALTQLLTDGRIPGPGAFA